MTYLLVLGRSKLKRTLVMRLWVPHTLLLIRL